MKNERISFTPVAEVVFTKEEVTLMMECSARHYDGTCKKAGAVGGFLYGIKNMFFAGDEIGEQSIHRLEWSELDILCKILEVAHMTKADERKPAFEPSLRLSEQLRDCMSRMSSVSGLALEHR